MSTTAEVLRQEKKSKSNKLQNEIKLSFPARSINESFARLATSGFVAQLDPTVEELTDIKTAVSEAVTNSIVHGYAEKLGNIYINIRAYSNNSIAIRVKDQGCGISDVKQAMQPLFTTCTGGERAGLGFAVMQSFMDKLKVYSAPGKGTTVVMTKKLTSKE